MNMAISARDFQRLLVAERSLIFARRPAAWGPGGGSQRSCMAGTRQMNRNLNAVALPALQFYHSPVKLDDSFDHRQAQT